MLNDMDSAETDVLREGTGEAEGEPGIAARWAGASESSSLGASSTVAFGGSAQSEREWASREAR